MGRKSKNKINEKVINDDFDATNKIIDRTMKKIHWI